MSKEPMILLWEGEALRDLSREQLIEAVEYLAAENTRMQATLRRYGIEARDTIEGWRREDRRRRNLWGRLRGRAA